MRFVATLCFLVLTAAAPGQTTVPTAPARPSGGRPPASAGEALDETVRKEIARLASPDRTTRLEAARKLRDTAILERGKGFGGQSAGICSALRQDAQDPKVLSFLLEVLEKIEPACADVLPALLRHPNAEIRAGAAPLVVRTLDAKTAGQHLVTLLGDPEARVRARAARSLGTLRGVPVKEPLLRALRDADEGVRKAAIAALVASGEPGIITALVEVLADPKSPARTLARLALAELTGRDFGDDAAKWRAGLSSDTAATAPTAGTSPELQKLAQQVRIQFESTRASDRIAGLQQARLALQRFGAAQTLDALLPGFERLLKDSDLEVRKETLVLLQSFRDPRLIDPLIRVLQDDPPLRAQALIALPDAGDRRLRDVLVALLADDAQITVSMALDRLKKHADPSLVQPVIVALRRATSLSVFTSAADLLTQVGRPAVGPLIEACARENASVKRVAVQVLGNLGDERALDVLLAALEDTDQFVKTNACEALKRLDSGGLHAALLARLDHADPQVKSRALEILGAQHSPKALDGLIAGLSDPNAAVQTSAAKGLGELGDARAAEALVQAIERPRFSARAEAAKALARLSAQPTIALVAAAIPRADAEARQFLIMALRETGAPAQSALLSFLDGADVPWKFEVAQALSYQISPAHRGRKDPRVVDRLVEFAAEDRNFPTVDENERIWFLQRLEDPRAVRQMLEMTRASQGKVPQTLSIALGKPDVPMVAEALIAALRDKDVTLRRAAAYILGYAKARTAVDPLLAAFDDPDTTVRTWAVWAVGQSFEYLRNALDANAIARRIVQVMEKRTESVDVRVRAAEALVRIRVDANYPALVAILTDTREPTALRVQAARALQGTSHGPATDALREIKSRPTEPQELREACMTPKQVFELHSNKRR